MIGTMQRLRNALRVPIAMAATVALMAYGASAQAQPIPTPTATPTVQIPPALPPIIKYEHYVEAGYITPPIVCNEFSPCSPGLRYRSGALRAALEFPIGGINLTGMLKIDARRYGFQHAAPASAPAPCGGPMTDPSCVREVGPIGSPVVSLQGFGAREYDYDVRAGVRALEPRLYLGVSYLQRSSSYGYPNLRGFGLGLEKLPDVDQIFSVYGGAYYYPTVRGSFTSPINGATFDLAYHVLRYDLGITLKPAEHSPLFVDAGYLGDRSRNANNAPSNITRNGPFVGLGLNF